TPQPVGTAKMEVAPEGEYTVGAKGDIDAGVWVVDEVLLDIYESEEAYKQNKDAIYSNVDFVDRQQLVKLIEGDYVVVQKGSIIFNETRPTKAVNLGDTLHLQEGNQYVVGKDFPEGFYTFYNLGLLELGEDEESMVSPTTVTIKNAGEGERTSIKVERKSTLFLKSGLELEFPDDMIMERVSADGTYGADKEVLEDMIKEDSDNKEE